MRIIFILPKASGPSGGVKTLYEHVAILRQAGYDAHLYAAKAEYVAPGFGIDTSVLSGDIRVSQKDVVVRAELAALGNLEHGARHGYRQLIFVQNHFYAHRVLQYLDRFEEFGVRKVISSSESIRRHLEQAYGLSDVPVVPYCIQIPRRDVKKARRSVAYMPRKRALEANFIRAYVNRACKDLGPIDWIEIDHMGHEEVVECLARSSIFLCLQRLEGFGLTALEAMALGCAVVGFTGQGGDEYATPENGIWRAEGDTEGTARALCDLLRRMESEDPAVARMVKAGERTVSHYTPERRDAALLSLFNSLEAG